MVEPVKSVLLVDLDGLGRSLAAAGGTVAGERLAERIADWSDAIESGELIDPAGTAHAIATRRCYVSADDADDARDAFVHAGFAIVECDGQSQADLCLAMDAMDAAADADEPRDFILLTAAPDLSPLVERLQARGHHVAVYVSEATAEDYAAAADMTIPAGSLIELLAEDRTPAPAEPAVPPAERSKVEAFAREIHTATNIPMFSPKTFADLFRFLAGEVTENGYHFNDTAKAVAERMAEAGRSVTSRQVVFVVKGLALKGHVFSTSDTAERLAEVFREQARYLISGAGIKLDAEREALLAAWIAAPAAKPAKAAPAAPPPPPARQKAPAKPARKPAPQRRPAKPESARPEAAKPEAAKPEAAKPATPPRVPERPKSAALQARTAPPEPAEPPKPSRTSADIRATIAARIAASAKMRPSARAMERAASPPQPPPPPRKPAPPADTDSDADQAIESSILAAIAEAVDVLVEDGGEEKGGKRSPPPERGAREPAEDDTPPERPPAEEAPPPADEEDDESGDIGDQIQRIVASYNRNRDDDERG